MATALIPLQNAFGTSAVERSCVRPRATFVAQIIATAQQVPQQRVRRRAEPDEAIAAYGAACRHPVPAGKAVRRSF